MKKFEISKIAFCPIFVLFIAVRRQGPSAIKPSEKYYLIQSKKQLNMKKSLHNCFNTCNFHNCFNTFNL